MILADTCIWIKFLKKREPFFSEMRDLLENGQIIGTDFIFGELLQGARDKEEKEIIIGYSTCVKKIEIPEIWTQAGIYSSDHNLISKGVGLIDTALLIVVKKEKAKVWTVDHKLASVLLKEEVYESRG